MTSQTPLVSPCVFKIRRIIFADISYFSNTCNNIPFHSNLVTFILFLSASPPDGSYAEVSKIINRKLKTYDKNVRPNDTGRKTVTFFLSYHDRPHFFLFIYFFCFVSVFFFGFISLFPGRPVEVLIEFKLMSFGKIREEDMVSCLSLANMGMRQKWAR